MVSLYVKTIESKEALAEFLLKFCDNPIVNGDTDMCDYCNNSNTDQCCRDYCLDAIVKGLNSVVVDEPLDAGVGKCRKPKRLYEKITESKEALAGYVIKCCDNPLDNRSVDMCDYCDKSDNVFCDSDYCLNAIIKGLDSVAMVEEG